MALLDLIDEKIVRVPLVSDNKSEVIKELQKIKKEKGDIRCFEQSNASCGIWELGEEYDDRPWALWSDMQTDDEPWGGEPIQDEEALVFFVS